MKISNVRTSTDFVKEIDKIVIAKNVTFFDAVIHYCELNNMEVETAATLIKQSTVLKAKIQIDAENLNMVKRSARLPI
jgi:hypothetical protein